MLYELTSTDEYDGWIEAVRDERAVRAIVKGTARLAGGLFGNVEPVGEGVSELKIDIGAGYRVYFVTRDRTIILLLWGGDKSSQRRDIKRAKEMAADL